MKERFYAGIELQKDLELVGFIHELENNPEVLILEKPEEFLIHECAYKENPRVYNGDRYDTGKTHIGYDFHYVTFYYRGFIVTVNAGTYYPFTDENSPGRYNFVIYKRAELCSKVQFTYQIAYKGLCSVDRWIDKYGSRKNGINGVNPVCIFIRVYYGIEKRVKHIAESHGSFREKIVMATEPLLIPSSTWSEEHKIIHVISAIADIDGHRDSFDVDVVTGRICG